MIKKILTGSWELNLWIDIGSLFHESRNTIQQEVIIEVSFWVKMTYKIHEI